MIRVVIVWLIECLNTHRPLWVFLCITLYTNITQGVELDKRLLVDWRVYGANTDSKKH